ncbi:MAG: DNA repair protein RecN [Clostridia bacterium]|nr:DNA repair protein RecN [Clostridia bacterium]
MLDCLYIENIAVFEKATIQFHTGFNVLTGETGAGKSLIIDAINAVLGERTSRELVRTGSDTARVTAVFSAISPWAEQQLSQLGFAPDDDGSMLITRTIAAEGKSSCTVNGRPATAALLREIGKVLLDLHGQHENQRLLSADQHLAYLDRFGDLAASRDAYAAVYRDWKRVRGELAGADMDEQEKARRLDILRYQIEEIEAASLQAGEEEALQARRTLYRNAEKVAGQMQKARALLFGDEDSDGAVSLAQQAAAAANGAARYLEQAEAPAARLQEALYELQDAAEELEAAAELLEFDPRERDEAEERWERIRRLTAKYGATTEDVLAFLEQAREQVQSIELSDEITRRLTEQERKLYAAMETAAEALTEQRLAAAERFAEAVKQQLTFLDMPNVSLVIERKAAEYTATGADRIEFLMSANVGEPPKAIARIASGGELSRIMLAIKAVLADADEIDTLIFDEIDTGISGRAAQKVGNRLRLTANSTVAERHRQVLCVTHLAQIAAQAQHHFLIEKSVRDGRTFTEVKELLPEQREQELARIIGGTVTEANLQAAREMLMM